MLKLNKDYKIGFRGIKTAISVFICSIISMFFEYEDMFCSSIAAVMCMQKTCEETIMAGINRVIGTVIGGFIGYLALEISNFIPYQEWFRILILPFCIIIVVYICNTIGRKDAVSIGCMLTLIILSKLGEDIGSTIMYVVYRVIHTIIGIIVATIINKYVFPNDKLDNKIKKSI